MVHTTLALFQPAYIAIRYMINPQYISTLSTSWLATTVLSWLFIITRINVPFFTSPFRHLPTPPNGSLFLGHLSFNGSEPPTDIIANMIQSTPNDGLIVLWGPFYLFSAVIPTRPDTFMDMVNTHNYDWEKPSAPKKMLARTLGEGLVNAEGSTHKSMRRVVAPAFSGRHIRDLVPLFYAKGLAFADALAREAKIAADGSLEMMSQMSRVTLDIIGAAGVGKDFNTIEKDDDPLANLYATITPTDRGPLILFLLINTIVPQWIVRQLRGTIYARVANAQVQLRQDVRTLMQDKKRTIQEKPDQQKDIIAIIMKSGEYTDDYLRDQLLTFLAAGHDTTASALTWTIWLLSINTGIQDRLRAECRAHLADKSASDIDAATFDAETMPYLTAVCNEVLRLYPTVPVTEREAVKVTTIGSQYIPVGTRVIISLWAINRDRSLWGPDAREFNPDRWLKAQHGGAESPYALVTFLHGPRSCIGQNFARTEMKCLLAALTLRFRFEMADPGEKVEVAGFVTIKPKNGLRVKLHDLQAEPKA